MDDLLYEAESARRFCGLNLSGPILDESTILHFGHLLERHQLGEALLETINAHLAGQGLRLQAGTIVNASLIAAPSSTKNQDRARPGDASDPQGQRVALQGGRRERIDAQSAHDGGEYGRRD